jgi:ribosomal-protein-serine acetyltransferase
MNQTHDEDLRAIDRVAATFFAAFTMVADEAPNIDVLYEVFLPSATIVNTAGSTLEEYDVRGFVEPRRKLLSSGAIEEFSEAETSAKTEIFGNIAHRFSPYSKSWRASGTQQRGSGVKSIQFVRTPGGWKIAALIWDDEPS